MKKIVLGALVALVSTSCIYNLHLNLGNKSRLLCNGPVETRTFDLTGFNAITVNGSADMEVFQADTFGISVTANNPVFDYLDYKVEDGVLILETKDNVELKAKTFDITIHMPELTVLTVNGAADAELKGGYKSDKDLDVIVNGAGDFEINDIILPRMGIVINGAGDIDAHNIEVGILSVAVHGAGDVNLSGKAANAEFSVSGAGDIDAANLACDNVQTHKSGIASIRLK